MYPPQYSHVFGTARLDRGQPPRSRGHSHLHHWTVVLEMTRGPRISSRPAQALPLPQRQKYGQGIGGESRKAVMARYLQRSPLCPLAVGTCPPGRYYHAVGFEGGPEYATWNWNRARGSWERRRGDRERERIVRGSPTPGHATRWSSASCMACVRDVGR